MIFNLFILVLIFLFLLALVFVLNSKYFLLSKSSQLQSLSIGKPSPLVSYNKLFFHIGTIIRNILPSYIIENLEQSYSFIGKDTEELDKSLGQSISIFFLLLFVYLYTNNFLFILLAFLISILMAFDPFFLADKANREIENNIDHLIRCLKILIVKTETPVLSALEISLKDLPDDLSHLKRQINKIISQSKKVGLVQTLNDWKTELPRFRDFISLMISINDGASKSALKQSFEDFLNKIEEDKHENQRANAENLQLYLMGPVVLMLLIVMLPMVDAISYLMKNSGVM